jgi:hypothetical protein
MSPYEQHCELVAALKSMYQEKAATKGVDQMKFERSFVIAMVDVSCLLAVDSLMTEDQFLDVCRTTFKAAYEAAPKFG